MNAATALHLPSLDRSASYAAPWTRALEAGLRRHGPTPTFDAVCADLGYRPMLTDATNSAALLLDGGAGA